MGKSHFTTREIARILGASDWAVRRVVDGLTPSVPRAGQYRLVPAEKLEAVKVELERRGHLRGEAASA